MSPRQSKSVPISLAICIASSRCRHEISGGEQIALGFDRCGRCHRTSHINYRSCSAVLCVFKRDLAAIPSRADLWTLIVLQVLDAVLEQFVSTCGLLEKSVISDSTFARTGRESSWLTNVLASSVTGVAGDGFILRCALCPFGEHAPDTVERLMMACPHASST
jgi:hypothetical protein